LKRTDGGFRDTPGTALKNDQTGEIVYVPPQNGVEIVTHMTALEKFINDDAYNDIDPLVRMAIIHHQFESIHPFPDGNGRLGRIINVLYLTQERLLDIPVLYLSRYITRNKADYYRLLQSVRETGDWEPWIIYMLTAVAETSAETIGLITGIRNLMAEYKQKIRSEHSKIYSQDLLNNLFRHPYTRIDFIVEEIGVSRQTAAKYLDQLADAGLLVKHQSGRNVYFVNQPLVALFTGGLSN
jgi:Fic family protein